MNDANSPKRSVSRNVSRSSAYRETPSAGQQSDTRANLRVVQNVVVQGDDIPDARLAGSASQSQVKSTGNHAASVDDSRNIESKQPVSGTGQSDKELDMELVHRVQRGDKSGFDLLVLRYQNKILNLITRYVHDPHEAQDVAQEAFIKAYRGLANFRGDSAFYTWLYRIAINTAKNHLITASRKISSDGVDAQEAEQYEGAHALRDYESPERSALNQEIAGVVEQSIAALPDDLRTALTLREFEGLSYEEIANVMECPIGTVRSRIFRAREAIDNSLSPLLDASSTKLM